MFGTLLHILRFLLAVRVLGAWDRVGAIRGWEEERERERMREKEFRDELEEGAHHESTTSSIFSLPGKEVQTEIGQFGFDPMERRGLELVSLCGVCFGCHGTWTVSHHRDLSGQKCQFIQFLNSLLHFAPHMTESWCGTVPANLDYFWNWLWRWWCRWWWWSWLGCNGALQPRNGGREVGESLPGVSFVCREENQVIEPSIFSAPFWRSIQNCCSTTESIVAIETDDDDWENWHTERGRESETYQPAATKKPSSPIETRSSRIGRFRKEHSQSVSPVPPVELSSPVSSPVPPSSHHHHHHEHTSAHQLNQQKGGTSTQYTKGCCQKRETTGRRQHWRNTGGAAARTFTRTGGSSSNRRAPHSIPPLHAFGCFKRIHVLSVSTILAAFCLSSLSGLVSVSSARLLQISPLLYLDSVCTLCSRTVSSVPGRFSCWFLHLTCCVTCCTRFCLMSSIVSMAIEQSTWLSPNPTLQLALEFESFGMFDFEIHHQQHQHHWTPRAPNSCSRHQHHRRIPENSLTEISVRCWACVFHSKRSLSRHRHQQSHRNH